MWNDNSTKEYVNDSAQGATFRSLNVIIHMMP